MTLKLFLMQIPFEFDPPKKDEDPSLKSKESDLSDTDVQISLQAKKPLTVTPVSYTHLTLPTNREV